jgi:hypothetical protein
LRPGFQTWRWRRFTGEGDGGGHPTQANPTTTTLAAGPDGVLEATGYGRKATLYLPYGGGLASLAVAGPLPFFDHVLRFMAAASSSSSALVLALKLPPPGPLLSSPPRLKNGGAVPVVDRGRRKKLPVGMAPLLAWTPSLRRRQKPIGRRVRSGRFATPSPPPPTIPCTTRRGRPGAAAHTAQGDAAAAAAAAAMGESFAGTCTVTAK